MQFVRELRDQRELVFAYLADGTVVWGLDRASGDQWWYAAEHADDIRPQLQSALANLDGLPLHDSRRVHVDASPHSASQTAAVSRVRTDDLAHNQPGHAVLAEIERKHAKATASTVAEMPGVLDEDIGQWCVGYVGEATVGAVLDRLGPAWPVLHGVPVGEHGSDIDHVVIGPPGVFTINTKHHPGGKVDVKGTAVFVGGTYQHYIRNADLEATRAETAVSQVGITVRVRPIVCVVGARLRIKQNPENVRVIAVEDLERWLRSQAPALSETEVAQLYDQLRCASTWTSCPPPAAAAPWVAQFAHQLSQDHVLAAQQRRRRATGRAEPGPRPRTTRAPNRKRRPRLRLEPFRVLVALVTLLCLALWGPQLLRTFTDWITTTLQHSLPSPGPSASSTPVVGKPCPTKGARATDAGGPVMVCQTSTNSKTPTWRLTK